MKNRGGGSQKRFIKTNQRAKKRRDNYYVRGLGAEWGSMMGRQRRAGVFKMRLGGHQNTRSMRKLLKRCHAAKANLRP